MIGNNMSSVGSVNTAKFHHPQVIGPQNKPAATPPQTPHPKASPSVPKDHDHDGDSQGGKINVQG
jgi:hypothetical protein